MSQKLIRYRIQLCKKDGSTPLNEPLHIEVLATNYHQAQSIALDSTPEHEVVSWGRAEDIDAYEEKVRNGL